MLQREDRLKTKGQQLRAQASSALLRERVAAIPIRTAGVCPLCPLRFCALSFSDQPLKNERCRNACHLGSRSAYRVGMGINNPDGWRIRGTLLLCH